MSKKVIVENILSLYVVQAANYILPLITFPYLVRILGIEKFGLLAFASSFIQYFVTFTDYGFNLTATREISIHRNDNDQIANICSAVYGIKLILFVLSCLIVLFLVLTVDKFNNESTLYAISLLAVIANLFYPVWFYQGIEKLKVIAVINLASRIVSTIAIFLFVHGKEDYLITALIQNGGAVLSGIIGFFGVVCFWKIKLKLPCVNEIKQYFKNGWYVFGSVMSATLVNNTNMFLLGMLSVPKAVGYFAIADKIIRIFINLVAPISSSIFPHVGKLFAESREQGTHFVKKIMLYGGSGFAILSVIIMLSASFLVKIITGQDSPQISTLVKIMALLPFTIFMDNLYGTQVLVNIGKGNKFLLAIIVPGVTSVIASLLMVPKYEAYATAIIFLVSEIMILLFMMFYVQQNKIYLLMDRVV